MKHGQRLSRTPAYIASALLIALVAGCGGGNNGKDPILGMDTSPAAPGAPVVPVAPGAPAVVAADPVPEGIPDSTSPTVTFTQPANNATGIARNAKILAVFSEEMNPATITGNSVAVKGPDGNAIAGTVVYVEGAKSVTFTPTTPDTLPADSQMTATISTAATDLAGNALAAGFVWTFRTAATADLTRPTVTFTQPANGAQDVPRNTRIAATFSEDMDPATINGVSVKLAGPGTTPVVGNVTYVPASRTALFAPSIPSTLPAGTTFTGTIDGAKDLAGNALAASYVWTFATSAAAIIDSTPPTVTSTTPGNGATSFCSNKLVNATFSEAMDPTTINATSMTVRRSGPPVGAPIAGIVTYDTVSQVASFAANDAFGAGSFTLTITNTVRDLAGNSMVGNRVSTFSSSSAVCPTAPDLGAAAPFGAFGGTSTVTNDGLETVLNGDLGINAASTKVTGFIDRSATPYTITTSNRGVVNGLVYTQTDPFGSVPGEAVRKAQVDAGLAFNAISPGVMPGGVDVSSLAQCPSCGGIGNGADELAGRTLPPGIYRSTTGTYDIGGATRTQADLVLDAGGDASAVWIFQTAAGTGTLNVGLTGPATPAKPIQVQLLNGAQAKNVFWYAPGGAVIGTGSTVVGTILSQAGVTLSTTGGTPPNAVLTTLNGRALSLNGAVTMTNTIINTPAP